METLRLDGGSDGLTMTSKGNLTLTNGAHINGNIDLRVVTRGTGGLAATITASMSYVDRGSWNVHYALLGNPECEPQALRKSLSHAREPEVHSS